MATNEPDHDEIEPVTDHVHETSWSANLEHDVHATDRDLVVSQAKDAIEQTAPGHHVNLVTHGNHGHPSEYLYEEIEEMDEDVSLEYVDQCGCGGYVTRVHVQ